MSYPFTFNSLSQFTNTFSSEESIIKLEREEVFDVLKIPIAFVTFRRVPSLGEFITDKYLMKKCLYKLRIQTPKFGIFEKQNMAADYIKNLKKINSNCIYNYRIICSTSITSICSNK